MQIHALSSSDRYRSFKVKIRAMEFNWRNANEFMSIQINLSAKLFRNVHTKS